MPNRGPKISPSIKKLIALEVIRCPGKPRAVLAVELKDIIERMGERPPGDDTLMRMISAQRNKEPSPLDKPWHLGTLQDYPIPTEAIPFILKARKQGVMLTRNLTIRQALWVSRLYTVIDNIGLLARIAWYYSLYEKISEPAFDPAEYDKLLGNPKKLIQVFEKDSCLVAQKDFKTYKKAFEQSTGIEMPGVSIVMHRIFIRNGTAYAVGKADIEINEAGELVTNVDVIIKPLGPQSKVIDAFKKQGLIKKLKNIPDSQDRIIELKKPVGIEIPADEWIQMQEKIWGVKNERTHNTTK